MQTPEDEEYYLDKDKSSSYIKEYANELLKQMNIYEVKDRLLSVVSGGEAKEQQ